MIEKDTVRLLRECDAGIKMGVSSIDEVVPSVKNSAMREMLTSSKKRHEELKQDIDKLLSQYGDEGKEPSPVAKSMSWVKTNLKMAFDGTDRAIADLMTDGCNMGVKSLSKYLNQYKAADESSKNIARRLISIEGNLSEDLRSFL